MIEEVNLVPGIELRRTRRNVVGVIIVAATCSAAALVFDQQPVDGNGRPR